MTVPKELDFNIELALNLIVWNEFWPILFFFFSTLIKLLTNNHFNLTCSTDSTQAINEQQTEILKWKKNLTISLSKTSFFTFSFSIFWENVVKTTLIVAKFILRAYKTLLWVNRYVGMLNENENWRKKRKRISYFPIAVLPEYSQCSGLTSFCIVSAQLKSKVDFKCFIERDWLCVSLLM